MTENTDASKPALHTDLDVDFHDGTTAHHVFTQGEVQYEYEGVAGNILELRDDHDLVIIPLAGVRVLSLSEYEAKDAIIGEAEETV